MFYFMQKTGNHVIEIACCDWLTCTTWAFCFRLVPRSTILHVHRRVWRTDNIMITGVGLQGDGWLK